MSHYVLSSSGQRSSSQKRYYYKHRDKILAKQREYVERDPLVRVPVKGWGCK